MTDQATFKRPARRLTVKNFSVIKEATLDFGKITVLIGPQASGKSLLCKLAFFCGQIVIEALERHSINKSSQEAIKRDLAREFNSKFPSRSWNSNSFKIQYLIEDFTVEINAGANADLPIINFSSRFETEFDSNGVSVQIPATEFSTYIPAGRSFYSIPNKAYSVLSVKNLDWITQRYASEYEANYDALVTASYAKNQVVREFADMATHILQGKIVHQQGLPEFESTGDRIVRPMEILSSGTLELLPLINSLSQYVYDSDPQALTFSESVTYVEEPELSIFPGTQSELVRLFAWLANVESLRRAFTITTHSPYLLTAFNSLLSAAKAVQLRPERAQEVEKVIPRKYWLARDDFAAYGFDGSDGILRPMMDEETGLINGDVLDSVSDEIGADFDKLMDVSYGD
jgi:hypothetical protein